MEGCSKKDSGKSHTWEQGSTEMLQRIGELFIFSVVQSLRNKKS